MKFLCKDLIQKLQVKFSFAVLETPLKGHLPENFSHTLEVRLANAYSEAFRQRYPKQGGSSEPIIVKVI